MRARIGGGDEGLAYRLEHHLARSDDQGAQIIGLDPEIVSITQIPYRSEYRIDEVVAHRIEGKLTTNEHSASFRNSGELGSS
jgi:hypothetical protein